MNYGLLLPQLKLLAETLGTTLDRGQRRCARLSDARIDVELDGLTQLVREAFAAIADRVGPGATQHRASRDARVTGACGKPATSTG